MSWDWVEHCRSRRRSLAGRGVGLLGESRTMRGRVERREKRGSSKITNSRSTSGEAGGAERARL